MMGIYRGTRRSVRLTARQRYVVDLLDSGRSAKAVGAALGVSAGTVRRTAARGRAKVPAILAAAEAVEGREQGEPCDPLVLDRMGEFGVRGVG